MTDDASARATQLTEGLDIFDLDFGNLQAAGDQNRPNEGGPTLRDTFTLHDRLA